MTKVIVDGRRFRTDYKFSWRVGEVVEETKHHSLGLVWVIEFPPIGRERKPKRETFVPGDLLKYSEQLERRLDSLGLLKGGLNLQIG